MFTTALKHLMKKVLEKLTGAVVDEEDDEEEETEQMSAQLHRSAHCSFSTLCDWYNTKTRVRLWGMTCVQMFFLLLYC